MSRENWILSIVELIVALWFSGILVYLLAC